MKSFRIKEVRISEWGRVEFIREHIRDGPGRRKQKINYYRVEHRRWLNILIAYAFLSNTHWEVDYDEYYGEGTLVFRILN